MLQDPLTLYKLIVLYMLNRVTFPLTAAQVSDFILGKEYTNFLTLQQVINELTDAGMIATQSIRNRTHLSITAEGKETLNFFENRIGDTIKQEIDSYFQENDNNESLKAENQPASTSNKNMDIKQLQDIGILTADEVKAANAETIALDKLKKMKSDSEAKSEELEATKKKLTDKEGELTKCQKELDGYKDEIKAARDNTEAQAKAKVEEAVKAGKIGPKDESAQAFWQKALEDDFVTASKQIDAMGANPALSTEKVAGGKTVTEKKEDEEESGFDRLTAAFNEELKND